MPYIDIDIDIDDYLSHCSSRERELLAESLYNDGYMGNLKKENDFIASTYKETEIVRLFNDIWNNKDFFTQNQIDQIRKKLREERVL